MEEAQTTALSRNSGLFEPERKEEEREPAPLGLFAVRRRLSDEGFAGADAARNLAAAFPPLLQLLLLQLTLATILF